MVKGAPFSQFRLARSPSLPAESTWSDLTFKSTVPKKRQPPGGETNDFHIFNGVLVTNVLTLVDISHAVANCLTILQVWPLFKKEIFYVGDSLCSLSAANPVPVKGACPTLRSCCALIGCSHEK